MNVLTYNQSILIGNLIADPKQNETKSGVMYCRFRLAVNRRHLSPSGEQITDYIDCVAWKGLAEFICRNFRQGLPIMVIGELQSGRYTDKGGNTRYTTEISVKDVRMVEAPAVSVKKPILPIEEELVPPFDPPF